ncbi:MAG TPA: FkbM family methyltransferase [Chthoniobacterales bacterium]|nr:FkbM family methyltransferase [Chthoniobacterales bacterium]
MRLRRLLKFLVPFGLIDLARNRRILTGIGRRLRPDEWLNSAWLVHEAEHCGLTLFPPGYAGHLKWIVDVGANQGQWSTMLLDCIRPEKLIMIEPEPAAFAVLQQRFGSDARVQLHRVAIGDRSGTARLQITADTTGASLLRPREEMRALVGSNWRIESEAEVPLTTLDLLLDDLNEVSLLKIDVQGFEGAVLAGAGKTLAKTKFLLVELNFMPQYEGGSWLGQLHESLTRDYGFFLANVSKPLVLNGRASMCDGLYVNPRRVEWVKPDFV